MPDGPTFIPPVCVYVIRAYVFEGCFLNTMGLALPYCICAYAEVSLTSWGDRYVCSFNMYVCVCADAEVSYRNWGDCSYVGTVYVVMLK